MRCAMCALRCTLRDMLRLCLAGSTDVCVLLNMCDIKALKSKYKKSVKKERGGG